MAAALLGVMTIGGIYFGIQSVLRLPQMPYNVRELFPGEHPHISMAVFSVLLVWLGFGPAWVGDLLARRPRQLPLLPLWAAVIGLVSWSMLRFAVTHESLGDVLGWPTLGWGGDWELLVRFVALQGTATLTLLIAGVAVGAVVHLGWRDGLVRGGLALVCGGPWLVLAWTVVVGWANTDNLTELIRATPSKWTGPVFLEVLLIVVSLNISALSYAWSQQGGLRKLLVTAVTPLLVVPGWALLWFGLEPAVEKYGTTFPAVRFLLGPDRKTLMPLGELVIRWSTVQLGIVAIVAVGGLIALCLRPRRDDTLAHSAADAAEGFANQDTGTPRRPGQAYLVITIIYAAFLIYGSLVPLNIEPMPLSAALDAFRASMRSVRSPWSQSDMVTNIAMFVPLTFCALGAWSSENRRSGHWWMAPAIFVGGVALSFALEFSQVFVPGRSTSVHDVISQTIGNLIGLAAWLVFGTPLTLWVRGLVSERDRPTLRVKLLYTYAALFVLYSLLPLSLTISAGQVWRKYKAGMINFVPFCGQGELEIVALLMKTALYVPIGYLLACRAGRGRYPLVVAAVGGVVFSAGVESLQVLVQSRIATATDIVLGAIGASIGGMIAWLSGPNAAGQGVHGAWWRRWGIWLKLPAVAGLLAVTAYQWRGGLAADRSTVAVAEGLGKTLRRPVGSMVYSAGPLDAVARLAQEFGAFLILGMLLQALLASSGRRRLPATGVGVVLVLAIALGQLVFARHLPDMTLMLTALAGVIASLWAHPRFVEVFLTPPEDLFGKAEHYALPPAAGIALDNAPSEPTRRSK